MEFFVDQIPEEKSAPKNLFDDWDDQHEAEETEDNRGPIRRLTGENLQIETDYAWRGTKELLRRDPAGEYEQTERNGEDDPDRLAKLIFAPEPDEQSAADECLDRVNPILGSSEPESLAHATEKVRRGQEREKDRHRQDKSGELSPARSSGLRIHLVFRLNG